MNYTKGEWHACQNGICPCKQIWSDNYPIAKVMSGEWGDEFVSIRTVGDSSLDLKVEPFMDKIVYGKIAEETAIANAQLIAAAPSLYEALRIAQTYIAREEIRKGTLGRTQLEEDIIKAIAKAEGK